jgi:hypothetical protein
MVGLVPTIHPSFRLEARREVDPRDKPEDDSVGGGLEDGRLASVVTQFVMVGLVPTIQSSSRLGARREVDPRDKPEDDSVGVGLEDESLA